MIETNQELYLNNLLSFRKTLTQSEVQKEIDYIETFIKEKGLSIIGPKVSTTYSSTQTMIPRIDVEILIPVDKEFTETNLYKLKKEFKLTNCLRVKHIGNQVTFQNTLMKLKKYISDNKLKTISTLYTVNICDSTIKKEIENLQFQAYISINPNIF